MMKFICYKKCSTCKKVEKMMNDKNIEYELREIDKDNPKEDEIRKWHENSNLDIKKFFNTSGTIYKEMKLTEKLKEMTLEEKYKLLSTNGMLVKRPIILKDDEVYVGPLAVKYIEEL